MPKQVDSLAYNNPYDTTGPAGSLLAGPDSFGQPQQRFNAWQQPARGALGQPHGELHRNVKNEITQGA